MSSRPSPTRQKKSQILETLRMEIVTGRWQPGRQLPTRVQIEKQFKASPVTVQLAFDQLARDGFISSRNGVGTFVADEPPHLTNYALALPNTYRQTWSRYNLTMEQEAQRIAAERGIRLVLRSWMQHYVGSRLVDELPLLERDVRSRRLAGIIFIYEPTELDRSVVMRQPDLPRVFLARRTGNYPKIPSVQPVGDFWEPAVRYLAERGRRRLASIHVFRDEAAHWARMQELAARHGMTTRPHWHPIAHVAAMQGDAARTITTLLMRLPEEDRPDALAVGDDHLVEHVNHGLLEAGKRPGEDVQVVAHANFPLITPAIAGIRRIGSDCRRVVATAFELIERMRCEGCDGAVKSVEVPLIDESETEPGAGPAQIRGIETFSLAGGV